MGDGGEAVFFLQAVDLFQLQRVQEIRGVRGNEDLATTTGIASEFLGQFRQQIGIELVLGFLDGQ